MEEYAYNVTETLYIMYSFVHVNCTAAPHIRMQCTQLDTVFVALFVFQHSAI